MPIDASSVSLAGLMLTALLCGAVASDLSLRRVPNPLVAAGLLAAVLLHLAAPGLALHRLAGNSAWAPCAGALAGAAALLPLYLVRACGAGDVKLLAMVGAFIGTQQVLLAAVFTLAAGGALALVMMLGRGVAQRTLANLRSLVHLHGRSHALHAGASPLERSAARMPYAVAIAAGTLIAQWPALTAAG